MSKLPPGDGEGRDEASKREAETRTIVADIDERFTGLLEQAREADATIANGSAAYYYDAKTGLLLEMRDDGELGRYSRTLPFDYNAETERYHRRGLKKTEAHLYAWSQEAVSSGRIDFGDEFPASKPDAFSAATAFKATLERDLVLVNPDQIDF